MSLACQLNVSVQVELLGNLLGHPEGFAHSLNTLNISLLEE